MKDTPSNSNEPEKVLQFAAPRFRLNGEEYDSAEVQQRAQKGDLSALRLIKYLLSIKSGIIKEIPTETNNNKKA